MDHLKPDYTQRPAIRSGLFDRRWVYLASDIARTLCARYPRPPATLRSKHHLRLVRVPWGRVVPL